MGYKLLGGIFEKREEWSIFWHANRASIVFIVEVIQVFLKTHLSSVQIIF